MSHLTQNKIQLGPLLAEDEHAAGAVILFVGTVREQNEGRPVSGMHYSAHEALAEQALQAIEQECCDQFPIANCQIIHRLGELVLGDISVAIIVRSPHRAAAYDASRHAIEELKKRVPIWKEERYIDGESRYLDGEALKESL